MRTQYVVVWAALSPFYLLYSQNESKPILSTFLCSRQIVAYSMQELTDSIDWQCFFFWMGDKKLGNIIKCTVIQRDSNKRQFRKKSLVNHWALMTQVIFPLLRRANQCKQRYKMFS